jgi:hypothetical protein
MAKESLIEGRQDIGMEEGISWTPDMKRLNIVDEMMMDCYRAAAGAAVDELEG